MSPLSERVVKDTTDRDVGYSRLTLGYHCLHCGAMVLQLDGAFYHPDGEKHCEAQRQDEQDEASAPEGGNSYAIFAPDAE